MKLLLIYYLPIYILHFSCNFIMCAAVIFSSKIDNNRQLVVSWKSFTTILQFWLKLVHDVLVYFLNGFCIEKVVASFYHHLKMCATLVIHRGKTTFFSLQQKVSNQRLNLVRHVFAKWPKCHNLASSQMFLWIFDEFVWENAKIVNFLMENVQIW